MTLVSNDPSLWPIIDQNLFYSYWAVAAGVVVVYDWVLTLGEEVELIWRQRWSRITVLYLLIRYIGIPFSVVNVLPNIALASLTDAGCNITTYVTQATSVVVAAMLGLIMIARLHAMYQGSRMMFIFLVIVFLVVNITCGVLTVITLKHTVSEELILSGTYMCDYGYEGDDAQYLALIAWMLNTFWEVLTLCLSVWISVKQFRDLQRLGRSSRSTIGDCFTVLIKSHVLYFASFVCVSCIDLTINLISSELLNPLSIPIGIQIIIGVYQILFVAQLFVLGPRLILGVREFNAKLVTGSDAETNMTSIVFQERVDIPTSSTI